MTGGRRGSCARRRGGSAHDIGSYSTTLSWTAAPSGAPSVPECATTASVEVRAYVF